jgi:hypothetical protein
MPKHNPKRTPDPQLLAKLLADYAAAGGDVSMFSTDGKNAAAVALGRQGGLKGGKARAQVLSAERRSEIARKAAATRWNRSNNEFE